MPDANPKAPSHSATHTAKKRSSARALSPGSAGPYGGVFELQRLAGNGAVAALFANVGSGSAGSLAERLPQMLRRGEKPIPRDLQMGETGSPLERQADEFADRVMSGGQAALHVAGPPATEAGGRISAPAIVGEALRSPGRPLDAEQQTFFERRYGYDFSDVRLHSGGVAARSAGAIGARAYTAGEHIVLGKQGAEPRLLAHELAHVVQQSRLYSPLVQRDSAPPVPRKNFVFLMGEDPKGATNLFFTEAKRYFQAHIPDARLVEDKRTLADLLDFISSNVSAPIGDLYIVSHGNEDGTLGFGLDSSSPDAHMSVIDLRNALHSSSGSSRLKSVASVVDAQTKIHIKGCDIGRTKEMIELIDEAFGGAGTANAPTHEQKYSIDTELGKQARKQAHDEKIDTFKQGLPALPPAATPIDPKLKGDARKQAQKDHDAAVEARKKAEAEQKTKVEAEEKRIKPELDVIEEKAQTVDSLSGPMFQRPGTKLFTAAELKPEIERLYGHLSEDQRKSLAARLVARDPGVAHDQQGQKVDRITPHSEDFGEPANVDEAKRRYQPMFQDNDNFVPDKMTTKTTPGTGEAALELTFSGTKHPKGGQPSDYTLIVTEHIPDDAAIIDKGKANTNNPDRYQWSVDRKHDKSGLTTKTAVGERVMAYLHHGSLDASAHVHFAQPETNKNFYYNSIFAPPAPPAKP